MIGSPKAGAAGSTASSAGKQLFKPGARRVGAGVSGCGSRTTSPPERRPWAWAPRFLSTLAPSLRAVALLTQAGLGAAEVRSVLRLTASLSGSA